MWFHRQAAQTAADAACAAGAMDILVDSQGGATGKQGFTLGTAYTCSSASTDAVCSYAKKNGYDGSTGNAVSVSFPTTAGTNAPPGVTIPPAAIAGAYPFIRVDVIDHVATFFAGLLSASRTADVRAFSTCGVELATAPIPLIVLDPRSTDGATLSTQGNPTISIYGGPQQSIEVDSSATAAVNIGGSAKIDLSKGGPNTTGSNLGVWGGPTTALGGFVPGTTGTWLSPSAPISDPFAQIPAPAQPTHLGTKTTGVLPGTNGCPVIGVSSCDEYSPGYYPGSISISGPGGPNLIVSIFDPGIYYVVGGFSANSNSCMRPSTALGDGSGGTMFYFADANSVNVTANSGKKCPTDPTTFFNTTSGTGSIAFGAKCTNASSIPGNLPASLSGSVLLGPCQAPTGAGVPTLCAPNCGINYGDPQGVADPLGEQRGFLFFQNRAKNANTNPQWQGGGQFLLSGTMYFHQCVTSGSDTGTGCSTASAFNDNVSLGGNSGSGTYILGQIIADQVTLGGTSGLTMDLNPTTVYNILKASIFQ
jgi:hypothetical protein